MTDLSVRATMSGVERRTYHAQYEVRGRTGKLVEIRGYATVYGAEYDMFDKHGAYKETVRGGAGKKTLSERPQVQLLLNHAGLSMAYTKAGTLKLAEDSTGLETLATVNTERSDIRDMVISIDDGNVDEMSFAFRTTRQEWSPDYERREIIEYNINRGDVSVVNFGASPHTAVALRAQDLDAWDEDGARALFERLQRRFTRPSETLAPGRSLALARALAEVQG